MQSRVNYYKIKVISNPKVAINPIKEDPLILIQIP